GRYGAGAGGRRTGGEAWAVSWVIVGLSLEAIAADPAAAPVNAAADRKSFGGHGHGNGAGGGVLAGAQDLSGKVAGMFTFDHDAAAVDDDMGDADRIGI